MATRSYHNLTSRFNGYFYAKESLKEGTEKLYQNHVDHFDKLIPVFNYTDLKESQSITAEMDKAYKKASSVIERHSILIKGQEHCNWIDDSYLIIGKSHFYRHNYIDALEVFDFMQSQYKKLPSHYEAMLWSFRCQNEVGTSAIAEEIMDQIRYDKKFPEKLRGEYYAICADYYCKKDDYSFAIENLTKAIPLTKSKREKTRYTFVLAQLYQKQGQLKKASKYFAEVVKMSPPYEMAFSAKINEARCFDVSSGSTADLKKRLKKMLRDDKNIDYQDQIYYALAEIADKEKQREVAIDYLHTSIAKTTTNTYQKGMSSLKLGDIYLQIPDFKGAQAYYDTAVGLLNPEYPDYEDIVTKSKSLTGLVKDINTIEREDSLQGLARLDEGARSKMLDKLEAKAKADAQEKKEKEEEAKQNAASQIPSSMTTGGGAPGGGMGFPGGTGERGWYFYNQQTLSFGFSEFQKKWGNRKLEDNWRRSNKQQQTLNDDFGNPTSQAGDTANGGASASADKAKGGLVYRDKASFLKDIPLTEQALKKSNDTIVNAFYDMASIYKDQLNFNDKSIQSYEELLRRYPDNRYKLSCYFQLYQAYTQAEDEPNALKYKNILLNDYPNSDYALIIKDPNYGKNKAFSKSEATKYYEQTYKYFVEQNYAQVLLNCATSDTLFPNSKYKPKYDFLKALCIGKTGTLDEYIKALRLVVAKYPKDEVKPRAADMVEVLLKLQAPAKDTKAVADTGKKAAVALYNFNPDVEHFCVILLPSAGVNVAKQKADISDFNEENFGSAQLNISDLVFNNEQQMISVKSFPNKTKAMEYYGVLKANSSLFKDIPNPEKFKILVISSDNYPLLYNKKDIANYEAFFGQKYLQ